MTTMTTMTTTTTMTTMTTTTIQTGQPLQVYEFRTNAKGRWLNRTILDVFTSEFGAYPNEYEGHPPPHDPMTP